ncbi:proline dehydrogenase family protein [Catalinimonas niigatensis]|uniref:proline dehydrogenase family protein n=1 Tax=Catalinimonas niigatensis TaxID=1397264 RepID=UPI0026656913|nr:proline dehydrogenase family protein [Catalinimonas niigatensis]WPP49393.1 proline dehydrogenase family protein [Catalinimonas niigatensis]
MFTVQPVSLDNTEIAFSYKSDDELRKTYLIFSAINAPLLTKAGTKLVKFALKLKLPIHGILRKTIFWQFCGGESISQSEPTIQMLASHNVKTILDYSAEGEKTEAGFEKVTQETLATITRAKTSENLPFCVFKVTGIASAQLLEKIQAKQKLTTEEQAAFERVKQRVNTLCKAAHEAGIGIFVDGEESWIQEVIDDLAEEMMGKYNRERVTVFNTYQMYRKDMLSHLKTAFQRAATYQYFLGAKLVRGAYMEKERERAEEKGYPDPIQPNKEATDDDYNKALLYCINNKQRITLVSGSHNEYSNQYLVLLMQKHSMRPDDPRVYFSQLYGMSDNISFNLAYAGYNVTKYVPYGPIDAVMPYLFRRAEENTSVAGQSSREYRLVKSELQRRKQIADKR